MGRLIPQKRDTVPNIIKFNSLHIIILIIDIILQNWFFKQVIVQFVKSLGS